jgi:hypothetical protein
MPTYTFHVFETARPSDAFEAAELADDAEAMGYAFAMLEAHPGAAYVVVWCGDRRVLTRHRINPALQDLLTQRPSSS